jgi:hypothetical protein
MQSAALSIFLCAVAIASPGNAAVNEVQVPAHTEWCKTVSLADATVLGTSAGQESAFRAGEEPIADCARSHEISQIGLPYVRSSSQSAPGAPDVKLEFCAVVTAGANPCPGIEARVIAAASVLAAVCAQAASADCKAEIGKALKGEPWKLTDEAVEALAWRFVQASDSANTSATILAALNGTPMQLGFSAAPAAPIAPYIVVAVPVPSTPAPAENPQ